MKHPATPELGGHIFKRDINTPKKQQVRTLRDEGMNQAPIQKKTNYQDANPNFSTHLQIEDLASRASRAYKKSKIDEDVIQKSIRSLHGHYNNRTQS